MNNTFQTGSYVYDMNTTDSGQGRGVVLETRRGAREILVCWANGRHKWADASDLSSKRSPSNV